MATPPLVPSALCRPALAWSSSFSATTNQQLQYYFIFVLNFSFIFFDETNQSEIETKRSFLAEKDPIERQF